MIEVTNGGFVQAIFGDAFESAHVTGFAHDPGNIPAGQHAAAWMGGYFGQYPLQPGTNQYFTISTFHPDEHGTARRRKALFEATHCIMLDDVREKLDEEQVKRLPPPTLILETSPGSFQWTFGLVEPCTDRARVENLLDGLVTNGLAPDGKDPGMKGVTRYARLPEGVNTKASKLVDGEPFKCRVIQWQPWNKCTLEQLAEPFGINLDAPRREARIDGAANVSGHPLLDVVRVKAVRSDGRYDVTCPWVDEHTNAADDGSAVFTNADGSLGFKCHHGACQERTGRDLLALLEEQSPGFGTRLANWQAVRALTDVSEVSFLDAPMPVDAPAPAADGLQQVMGRLAHALPDSDERRQLAEVLLKAVDQLSEVEKVDWHKRIKDVMHWNAAEFKAILKDMRGEWYANIRKRVSYSSIQPMPKENYPDVVFNETTGSLKVVSTLPNLKAMIDHYGIHASYDVITKKTQVIVPGMSGSPDNQDNSALTHVISLGKLNELNTEMIPAYLETIADERQINPVAEWIVSKPWDGVDRLPLIYDTLTMQDDYPLELRDTLVRRWLISAVAAAMKPNDFKSRGVLTLTGEQSLGKTSWLQSLVPDVRLRDRVVKVDHLLEPSNKDSVLTAVTHWLVELGELDSSFRKSDIGRIKGFITAGMDKLRRPYARLDSEYQRRTVFFASVNDDKFLVDETGNTRFWTIAVKAVNYQHGLDMQQVWAQVAHLYQQGEQWWLTREEEARLEKNNNQHRVVSSIHELLEGELLWSANLENWTRLSASQVLQRIGFDKPTNAQAKDAGRALRELGCEVRKSKGLTKYLVPPNKSLTRVWGEA